MNLLAAYQRVCTRIEQAAENERAITRALEGRIHAATSGRRVRKPRVVPADGLRTLGEAAAKVGCSEKTLKGFIDSGALRYVNIGHGTKRPRRRFTDSDIAEFIANQTEKDSPCPSIETRARRTGISISNGEVIGFTARRSARAAAKRKR
jgi:hypothetical protein